MVFQSLKMLAFDLRWLIRSRISESKSRQGVLMALLMKGELSTQEELVEELMKQNFEVTQSTISRDLRKLGAIKVIDSSGQTVYRLSEESAGVPQTSQRSLKGHLVDINHNGSMIVLHTTVGSASMVARHLDTVKPEGVLGTLAGDDTIFIAPTSTKHIESIMRTLTEELT